MAEKTYKRTLLKATPIKMVLNEGDSFIGKFVGKNNVEREKGENFTSYNFETEQGVHVYFTGTGFEDVDFKAGDMYEIIYNGTTETIDGRPFKSFTIYSLA